jgi:hypothetical protein
MYCCDHQIKDDKGSRTCSTHGRGKKVIPKKNLLTQREAACVIAELACTAMTKWALKKFDVTKVDWT